MLDEPLLKDKACISKASFFETIYKLLTRLRVCSKSVFKFLSNIHDGDEFLGTVNGFDRLTIFVINFIMDLHRDLKCVYCWMPQMFDVVWSCSRGIFPILVVVWFAFSNLFYFFICCFVVNLSKSKLNILKLYTYLFKQTLLAVRTLTFSFAVFDFKHSHRDKKTLAQRLWLSLTLSK